MKSILSILLVLAVCTVYGQSSKKRKRSEAPDTYQQNSPSTVDPNFTPAEAPHRSSRKRGKGSSVESQKEYAARMQATVKEKRKAEKIMEKPQYSNPMYFGHKRPPKKRAPNKMKYCKECGIRH